MYYSDDDNSYDSEYEFNRFDNYVPTVARARDRCVDRATLVLQYIEKTAMAESNAAKLIAEEEREKSQGEKKRAKKKKKREKKPAIPQDDSEAEEEKEGLFQTMKNSRKAVQQVEDKEEEEALDPSCAFISGVAVKKKIMTVPENRNKNTKKNGLQLKRMIEEGLRFVEQDRFQDAAKIYSEIIQTQPNIYAFYGNRSYCYERLGNYELALQDANKALSLNSKNSVNHYRKASALVGLKKFVEAEAALCRVLKIDPRCVEAKEDLILIKKIKLLELGFDDRVSDYGARNYESLEEAIANLVKPTDKLFENNNTDPMNDIYASEDEDTFGFLATTRHIEDPLELDPSNPRKLRVLWLGNLSQDVTDAQVKALFSKYGIVDQVVCSKTSFSDKQYAFVNFRDHITPGKAMLALQGHLLGSNEILIKFPIKKLINDVPSNSTDKKPGFQPVPINGGECAFWRSRGFCYHENNCRYKHVKAHRNIDRPNYG